MWIKDMFFFHGQQRALSVTAYTDANSPTEHPRAINYVEFSIITSPYLGPLITAFIVSGTTWRWAFWLCTILAGISLLLVFFMDETLFDRSTSAAKTEPSSSRWQRLLGIGQARSFHHRSLLACLLRPAIAITKLPVFLTIVYYFLNTAWVVGVNTTVSIWLTDAYFFTPRGIGKQRYLCDLNYLM